MYIYYNLYMISQVCTWFIISLIPATNLHQWFTHTLPPSHSSLYTVCHAHYHIVHCEIIEIIATVHILFLFLKYYLYLCVREYIGRMCVHVALCVSVCVVINDPTHLLLLYQLHTIRSHNHCLEC